MSGNEDVHVLLGNSVVVDAVPEASEGVGDIICIGLRPAAIPNELRVQGRVRSAWTYMTQVFSFARMNSDGVRKGTPCILVTVDVSRWRGPNSPAGCISICETGRVSDETVAQQGSRKMRTSIAGIKRRYVTHNLFVVSLGKSGRLCDGPVRPW